MKLFSRYHQLFKKTKLFWVYLEKVQNLLSCDSWLDVLSSLYLSPVFPPFRGKGEPVTELSWLSCRQLLYQSVATVLAHAGFESANESVLETLTDMVHEHYLRLTKLLRVAVDREACRGSTPFPDVVEQVFHEVGIGSVLALQRFWQVRIKDYHSYMLQVRYLQCYSSFSSNFLHDCTCSFYWHCFDCRSVRSFQKSTRDSWIQKRLWRIPNP